MGSMAEVADSKIRTNRFGGGFTIVELLIVIVVIAILAAIVIVQYNGVRTNATISGMKSDLQSAISKLGIAKTDNNGAYPSPSLPAGIYTGSGNTFSYISTSNDTFCLSITSSNASIPSYFVTESGVIAQGACALYIQTITNASCPTTRTQVVDARDNRTYWVQQLADGKCWMLTNLAYAGGGATTYTDTVSIADGSAGTFTYTAAIYYIPATGSNPTTTPTSPSTSTTGMGQYGYSYNWCAAMGAQLSTSACSNSTTPLPNANISICPSGWRLPASGVGGGEFQAITGPVHCFAGVVA